MPADGLSRLEELETTQVRTIPPVVTLDQVHYMQKGDKFVKALACFVKFRSYPQDPQLQQFVDRLANISVLKRGIIYVV